MSPTAGRLALVGHICGGSPIADGALAQAAGREALAPVPGELAGLRESYGMLSVRLRVEAGGAVASAEVLFDNLISESGQAPATADAVVRTLSRLRFAAAGGPS